MATPNTSVEGTAGSRKLIKRQWYFCCEQVLSGWQHLRKSRWTPRSLKGTCNARACQPQLQATTWLQQESKQVLACLSAPHFAAGASLSIAWAAKWKGTTQRSPALPWHPCHPDLGQAAASRNSFQGGAGILAVVAELSHTLLSSPTAVRHSCHAVPMRGPHKAAAVNRRPRAPLVRWDIPSRGGSSGPPGAGAASPSAPQLSGKRGDGSALEVLS